MLRLSIFQPKNKTASSLFFFKRCSKFLSEKRIHNTLQIRGEKTQRQQVSLNVNFRMKWVVLPFSESYSEETKNPIFL